MTSEVKQGRSFKMTIQMYIENVPEQLHDSPYFVAVVEYCGLTFHSAHTTFMEAIAEATRVGGVVIHNY
jgi:hypothetical protein